MLSVSVNANNWALQKVKNSVRLEIIIIYQLFRNPHF